MTALHSESPVLYVLGRFEVRAGDRLVLDRTWNRHHARRILKILAVTPGHALSRDAVHAIIAPGMARPAAANALYKALYYVRHACSAAGIPEIMQLTSEMVALAPELVVDADVFREQAERALRDGGAEACDAALLRYGGDLLPDADDAWAAGPRDDLRRQYDALLFASGFAHAAARNTGVAIARFETLVAGDTANERAQIALIEQYVAAGWRDRAMRQYEQCREALERRHGMGPSPALERAREAIIAGAAAPQRRAPARPAVGVPERLIGRDAELSRIAAAVAAAADGRGRLLLVAGDPGAGKSRLAQEAERLADEAGLRVLWGRCFDGDGAPVYWPWLQVLRRFFLRAGAAASLDAMGDDAPVIAQVSPDAQDLLDGPADVTPLAPEDARVRLFDAVTRTFVRAAESRPLLVVLDDLHSADAASLHLLRAFARAMSDHGIALLGTYRPAEAARAAEAASALADIVKLDHATAFTLEGLDAESVGRFIVEATGVTPARATIDALAARTDGNPLFLRETLRWLGADAAERLQEPDAPDIPLPATVRDVVTTRLMSLSPGCAEALEVAATVGRDFRLELLRDSGIEDPLPMVEEAEAARIIAPSPAGRGRFMFTHAVIRETLYARMTPERRRAFHRRVGEAIEASAHGNREVHLPELSHHFSEAAADGVAARAVDYARRSAERSARLLAWEGAVTEYRRALAALDLLPPDAQHERGALLIALGDACKAAGDGDGARDAFRDAAGAARRAGDAGLLARAALGFEGAGVTTGILDRELVGLLREALAALPAADSGLRARLLGRLAMATYWAMTAEERDDVSRGAVDMARRSGDAAALAYALKSRHFSLGSERPEERLGLSTELVRMAQRARDLELEFAGHATSLADYLELGDIRGADAELARISVQATELGQPRHQWASGIRHGMRAMLAGRFAEGERLIEEARAAGRRAGDPNVDVFYGVQMITLRTAQGRLAEIEAPTKRFVERLPAVGAWKAFLAHIYSMTGKIEDARVLFNEIAADEFAGLPKDWTWNGAAAACALVAARLNDADRAAVLYAQLSPYAGRAVVVPPGIACWGATSLYLGVLALTMGRRDDAIAHVEAAMDMNTRMESRPWIASSSAALANLLARGDAAERRSAALLARSALEEARLLGMVWLAERAQATLSALGAGGEV